MFAIDVGLMNKILLTKTCLPTFLNMFENVGQHFHQFEQNLCVSSYGLPCLINTTFSILVVISRIISTLSSAKRASIKQSASSFRPCLQKVICRCHQQPKTSLNDRTVDDLKSFIFCRIGVVENMLDHINEPLCEFLTKPPSGIRSSSLFPVTTSQSNPVSILAEISSILQMLTSILDRFMSREKAEKALRKDSVISENDSLARTQSFSIGANAEARFISNAFAFSFVWAVAGRLSETYVEFYIIDHKMFASRCIKTIVTRPFLSRHI